MTRRLAKLVLLTVILACTKTVTPTMQQATQDTSAVTDSTSTAPATTSSEPPVTATQTKTDATTSSTTSLPDTGASGFPELGTPPPSPPRDKTLQKQQAYVYVVDTFYDWPPNVHAWVEKAAPPLAEFDSKNRKNIETLRQKEGYKRISAYSIFGVPVPPRGRPHPLISFRHTVVVYEKPAT